MSESSQPSSSEGQPPAVSSPSEALQDFRWQAFFQRSTTPLFVLNRNRRFLFVNAAWEALTGMSLAEVRGLVCLRETPTARTSLDLIVRSLCAPPAEALAGQAARTRKLLPGGKLGDGWWDFEFFPIRDGEANLGLLGRICPMPAQVSSSDHSLPERIVSLQASQAARYSLCSLTSRHPAVARLADQARWAASTNCPVCIVGEPGTGKEWLARVIHYSTARAVRAFVRLDCSRLPVPTIANALFGPPSQVWRQPNASLYLSDVTALPRDLQQRLVETASGLAEPSGPRVISGFTRDPVEAIRNNQLLPELYYRLGTFSILVPPLRERLDDLPMLVAAFMDRINAGRTPKVKELTTSAWKIVRDYSWPGNLRELLAVIQSAARYAPEEVIDGQHLPAAIRAAVAADAVSGPERQKPLSLEKILEEVERRLITIALRKSGGHRSRAADLLSIWRQRLVRRMEALKIESGMQPESEPPEDDAANQSGVT